METNATAVRVHNPSYQAYQILHIAYVAAPLIAGLDKFFDLLTDWTQYLAPVVAQSLPFSSATFMKGVGIVEVLAGLIVAFKPSVGGWVVGAWLCGIIVNLLMVPGYYDIALRDFGLALGAFALARIAVDYEMAS
jgi:hypothetical protein